jgi:hypothetical protein
MGAGALTSVALAVLGGSDCWSRWWLAVLVVGDIGSDGWWLALAGENGGWRH